MREALLFFLMGIVARPVWGWLHETLDEPDEEPDFGPYDWEQDWGLTRAWLEDEREYVLVLPREVD